MRTSVLRLMNLVTLYLCRVDPIGGEVAVLQQGGHQVRISVLRCNESCDTVPVQAGSCWWRSSSSPTWSSSVRTRPPSSPTSSDSRSEE